MSTRSLLYHCFQDAEHSLATGIVEVDQGVTAFILGVLTNTPRPTMTWDWYNGTTFGNLTVYTSEAPIYVSVVVVVIVVVGLTLESIIV